MKLLTMSLLVFVAFSPALAQDLPVIGKIDELKTAQKVYIAADSSDTRARIKDQLSKTQKFEYMDDPALADFILEYVVLTHKERKSLLGGSYAVEKSEMRAWYTRADGAKVIAWSDTQVWDSPRKQQNDRKLADNFSKALKKALH